MNCQRCSSSLLLQDVRSVGVLLVCFCHSRDLHHKEPDGGLTRNGFFRLLRNGLCTKNSLMTITSFDLNFLMWMMSEIDFQFSMSSQFATSKTLQPPPAFQEWATRGSRKVLVPNEFVRLSSFGVDRVDRFVLGFFSKRYRGTEPGDSGSLSLESTHIISPLLPCTFLTRALLVWLHFRLGAKRGVEVSCKPDLRTHWWTPTNCLCSSCAALVEGDTNRCRLSTVSSEFLFFFTGSLLNH